ncbi:MAG: hypothetical protein J6U23_04430 [Clostridiales bacterium]|nr:hypothetical protein [Clostridiales bacterium]
MISKLKDQAYEILLRNNAVPLPEDEYTNMKYPSLLPLMRFRVDQYNINGYGHVMMMHTTTKMGMELLTMSFMPSESVNLPYLLIDAMSMKKKRCVFVEYYGCGEEDLIDHSLKEVYDKWGFLPDYIEKDNWYIKERRPYSLIKSGEENELTDMALDSVRAYLGSISEAKIVPEYEDKLRSFRERMIVEGNPSSKTLNMLLKRDGARVFMERVIMPIKRRED